MKRVFEFAKRLSLYEWLIAGALVGVLLIAASFLVNAVRATRSEAQVRELQAEKQQAFKERDEARARELIKQGEINAKDEQIQILTSQLAESDSKVVNAHKETQNARSNYDKVRRDPAHFNSADDAGRVDELRSVLKRLYPDQP